MLWVIYCVTVCIETSNILIFDIYSNDLKKSNRKSTIILLSNEDSNDSVYKTCESML